MPEYLVEQMIDDAVVTSITVTASTPLKAAMAASGNDVGFRTYQEEWIRVSERGRQAFEYVVKDARRK